MPDTGARYADKQIADVESRITALYETAYSDINRKYMAFVQKYKRDDEKYRQMLADGEITKATYDAWLRGQVFQGKRWKAQLADLAQTLTNTTQTAMDIINDAAPGVFAMNANYAEYEIEKAGNVDCGFGLYDEDTVRRIVRDDPNLLPPSKVDIPLEQQWNQTLINRQIGVGIVTGEGIEAIAKRLQRAANMSANQARTHARTAMTGAQNAGRIEGYHRAEDMGITLEKEWMATLDGHTRHAHAALDGQRVPVDEPFKSELGEIMYPGDPNARPANVYNCRCTLISYNPKYPPQNAMRRPNMQQLGDKDVQKPIKDMTYAEWAGWKEKLKEWKSSFVPAKTLEEAEEYAQRFVHPKKGYNQGDISFKGMDLDMVNTVNRVLTDVYDRFDIPEMYGTTMFDNIRTMNFRDKKWKNATEGGIGAAYDWANAGTLYINQKIFASSKTSSSFIEKANSVLKQVLDNADLLLSKPDISASKKVYIQALKKTGVQTFAQKTENFSEATFVHEIGHMIEHKILIGTRKTKGKFDEFGFDLNGSKERYSGNISGYSVTDKHEYIAESFVAYYYGYSDLIDPALAEIFKNIERRR